MGRKNTKGTQKVNPIINASVESPPYETAYGASNTEEVKKSKQDKNVDLYSCKCKPKKTNNTRKRTRTWESIKELYGDADTTEVWDNGKNKPKIVFGPELHKKDNTKEIIHESENNDVVISPTSDLKNTPAKLSLIGLYRKHKNKNNRNKIKIGRYTTENSMDTDVISSPYPEQKVKFMSKNKSKKVKPNYGKRNYDNGDICTEGPCREALENLYNLQGLKYTPNQQDKIIYNRTKSGYNDNSKKEKKKNKTAEKEKFIKKLKNKQNKAIKTAKSGNVGYGDQISPTHLKNQDLKNVLRKYSFTGKKMGHTCKCKNNNGSTLQAHGDQISPISLKKQDLRDLQCKCSFIDKMMGHTCKCKNNNGSTLQAHGDQISPISLKKQDLRDLQCKCSFIDKMMGHTCKCKNNNGSTLQAHGDQISPISLKKQDLRDLQCKCSFIDKMMGHTCKCKNNNGSTLQAHGDQISPISLKKQDLQDLQCKCSFIGKMMGHTICKCKNNNGNTVQTLKNVNNDISKKEKKKTKTPAKENKIMKTSKNKQAKSVKTTKDGNVGDGDQISPIALKNQDVKDVLNKYSSIGKMVKHICKCKNNNRSTFQTSSNVKNVNNEKEKLKTKTPTRENKTIKKSRNKQAKAIKTTKGNVGYDDQVLPITLKKQDLKDARSKYSFIGKMMGHTICKCKNNNGRTLPTSSNVKNRTVDPLLEMKVNLTDMRVLNSSEVDKKIRTLGRIEKRMSCICPSHINSEVCERGPCEKALENPHSRFDCKCQKQNIIKCKDSTCDLKFRDIKVKSKIKKKAHSPMYNGDKKPLFEVMLDPAKMKIMNSNELKDIIRNASQNNIICPTGICNTMSKQRNVQINCKCVGKKLSPLIDECTERTCTNPEKRGKLSCLCSRVFSKSEAWTEQEGNRMRRSIRDKRYDTNIKRNGVMINVPRDRTPKKGNYVGGRLSDVWCKCFCECNVKKPKEALNKLNKKKPIKKRRRRRKGFFRKKKKDQRTVTDKILDCLEREQEDCEKKVIKKTKEYKKNEKMSIKENKKIVAEQKRDDVARRDQRNCLTNLLTGLLNVGFESVKTVFKISFSTIRDPISSYVYVKEKVKNPPVAVIRIIEWFVRTWKDKTSAIAKALEESTKLQVIADHIEDSAVYNALSSKAKSPAAKMEYARKARIRKRRIQKRHDEAIFGCRHMLLTTMRKTPCLWFYHVCPDLYPQCLSFIQFMNNFLHILLYCGAVLCWTPCIVACELCRGFMCCFLCTN